jgi:hypothetical protein
VIVATVGIVIVDNSTSSTVPLAMLNVSSTSSIASAVVGTDTVPVVAPAGTFT